MRSGGEQGLLSIAFHPAFPATPYFYVYYTRLPDGAIVIARYRVSAGNPNLADPRSPRVAPDDPASAATQPQRRPAPVRSRRLPLHRHGRRRLRRNDPRLQRPERRHAARQDPAHRREPELQHAALLRHPAHQPVRRARRPARRDLGQGLRNPWRFSFDRHDRRPLHRRRRPGRARGGRLPAGRDAGRPELRLEGHGGHGLHRHSRRPPVRDACPPATRRATRCPILDYGHTAGHCSITGGYRYRGTQIPALAGNYLYADYCTGEIFEATESGGDLDVGPALRLRPVHLRVRRGRGRRAVRGQPSTARSTGSWSPGPGRTPTCR